jgi:hypothetical protein
LPRINAAELKQRFPLNASLYSEYFQGERSAEDFPTGIIICADCRSVIDVLHPHKAAKTTP